MARRVNSCPSLEERALHNAPVHLCPSECGPRAPPTPCLCVFPLLCPEGSILLHCLPSRAAWDSEHTHVSRVLLGSSPCPLLWLWQDAEPTYMLSPARAQHRPGLGEHRGKPRGPGEPAPCLITSLPAAWDLPLCLLGAHLLSPAWPQSPGKAACVSFQSCGCAACQVCFKCCLFVFCCGYKTF